MAKRNLDILLVRMDKLGDLVLSLPVDEHPVFAGQNIQWFITKGLGFVAEQSAPKRTATEFGRRFSPFEFARMVSWLRHNQPEIVVLLHNPWWVSLAMWWAGVPIRMGRHSQWHSFLFVNLPIKQRRSAADRHESDFNFDLVEWGFSKLGFLRTRRLEFIKKTFLRLVPPNPFGTLSSRGLQSRGFRIVHPGMGGSALNWPTAYYRELIEKLAKDNPVLITGTKADQKYLAGLEDLKGMTNVKWIVGELKSSELLDLLSEARSVIAPSTGVLHLAAALGTPTVGLYSPRRVEHPRRWGPRGAKATFLVPAVQDAEMFAPDVMNQITVEQVANAVFLMERSST
jgi:heptosyltransferase I